MSEASLPGNLPDNHWLLRQRHMPNTTWENGATYDPTIGQVVWFGGHVGHLYPQSNYTFLYDIERNRFLETQPRLRPQRRCLVFIAYADSCRRCIAQGHGGPSHGSIPEGAFDAQFRQVVRGIYQGPALYDAVDDSWETARPLPPYWPARPFSPICYEPSTDVVAYLANKDLWMFSPWTNRVHSRPLPEPLHQRTAHAWAADPTSGKIVLFGGLSEQAKPASSRNDTWTYDVSRDRWKQCQPDRCPPRGAPRCDSLVLPMVHHPASGTMLTLVNSVDAGGGNPEEWGPAELWSFDPRTEQWQAVETTGDRPAYTGLLAWAMRQDVLVLLGGGADGRYAENPGKPKKVRPAHSREVRICRVRVPGQQAVLEPQPERVKVEAHDTPYISLSWDAQPDEQYDVFRATCDPLPGLYEKVNVKPVIGGSYDHKTVDAGVVYAYQVARVGAARRSLPAFNQPWRPGGLMASVESADRVVLTWRANAEADVVAYRVYRACGAELDRAEGVKIAEPPASQTSFVDNAPGLGDGVIRTYWVTAVNRGGIESGASPLAYTVPDAVAGLAAPEGVGPSNIDGEKLTYLVNWDWPEHVKVAGFNVYHAVEVINTFYYPGAWEHNRFESYFEKLTDAPVAAAEFVYRIPKYNPHDHYFVIRAVNVLGQEGFYSDIVSPTDRRFRPSAV